MTSIEDIAAKAGGTPWFQLNVWADRSMSWSLVDRAAAGFLALFVTVDVLVKPNRKHNKRNGFLRPFDPGPCAMIDMVHPRWLLSVMAKYLMTTGMPRYGNLPSMRSDNLNWDDIKELRRRRPRALVIKSILWPEGAGRAVDSAPMASSSRTTAGGAWMPPSYRSTHCPGSPIRSAGGRRC
jgi:isopentenyl diphosphate isomerase/L-lactate dehydrogenase-like FMN-dependent dehydrogenase